MCRSQGCRTKARELASAETLALARPISSQTSIAHPTNNQKHVCNHPAPRILLLSTSCFHLQSLSWWLSPPRVADLIQTPQTCPVEQTKNANTTRAHRPSGYIIANAAFAECFLRDKFFFLAYPACPALYVATSVFNLPCRPARLPGLTLVFPAVPRVPYFTHTLMSSMYPSASRVAEAIAVVQRPALLGVHLTSRGMQ